MGNMHKLITGWLAFMLATQIHASTEFWPGQFCLELEELCPHVIADASDPFLSANLQQWLKDHRAEVQSHFPTAVKNEAWELHRLGSYLLIQCSDDMDILAACHELKGLKSVRSATPDWITHINIVPNDPAFSGQWALENRGQAESIFGQSVGESGMDIGAVRGWDHLPEPIDLKIAILDTGVDLDHPEFAGRLLPGFNFINNTPNVDDDNGHGTAVAGLAAAEGNNNEGMAGIAWQAQLLPYKVFNSLGQGPASAVANALNAARQQDARVVNFSGGIDQEYPAIEAQILAGLDQGMLCISAAGNLNLDHLDYPARLASCVGIGALDPCGYRKSPTGCDGESWWGSNHGEGLDLYAPGVRLLTTNNTGGLRDAFNGSSAACAYASGVFATLIASWPDVDIFDLREIVIATSMPLNGEDPNNQEAGIIRLDCASQLLRGAPIESLKLEGFNAVRWLTWHNPIGVHSYEIQYRRSLDEEWQVIDFVDGPPWSIPTEHFYQGSGLYRVRPLLLDDTFFQHR
jgi:hypothetical protein